MNLPEGWQLVPVEPTLEMCEAMDKATGPHSTSYSSWKWREALAVAPTPPASIHDRNIKDIIGEWLAGIVSSDNALEEIRAMITDVPTPPAQEDEPVAYQYRAPDLSETWSKCSQREYDLFFSKQPGYECRKLYTRPADDKLRKAAEEARAIFNDIDQQMNRIMDNLRAALEGK